MTEAEWLACEDPEPMLAFVLGKASERKLRLFAVTCCESACRLLQSRKYRSAIEVSEQFADGLTSDAKLGKARSQVRESAERTFIRVRALPWSRAVQSHRARRMVVSACSRNIAEVLQAATAVCVTATSSEIYEAKRKIERQQQAARLREIFQYYPRQVIINSTWITSTVVALAAGIYDEKAFDRMPILADSLQDAGCDSDDILNHCRGEGPHVRGCWVVDLVLGKE